MKNDIAAILGYAAPGTLIAVLEQWQNLFRGTWFARPGIDPAAYSTALIVGVILCFVIVALWRHHEVLFLRRCTILVFMFAAVLLMACGVLHYALREPFDPDTTRWLESIWDLSFVLAMVVIFALVTVAAMLIGATIRQSGTPA